MNENNFTELYKTFATDKLLDIVDNPDDYQPIAVDAARMELDSRQLSAEQLQEAKQIQADRQNVIADQELKNKAIQGKFKSVGSSLVGTFNPIQNQTPNSDKYIKLVSLFLGGLTLYQFYREFGLLKFMFTDSSASWDFSMVLYFLPLFLVPTAGLLLWFRKKSGWILSTLFFSYETAGSIPLFLSALGRQPTGNAALDIIFPVVSPAVYIGTFLLYSVATWVMTKEGIRGIYGINRPAMFITMGLGAATIIFLTIVL